MYAEMQGYLAMPCKSGVETLISWYQVVEVLGL